jgi:uncharacterized heparinase superfamily protein
MSDASLYPLEPPVQQAEADVERRDRGALRRIRDTRFAEVAYRGWQEASKWLDRVAPMELPDRPDAVLWRHARDLVDADTVLRILRDDVPARFFRGATDAVVPRLLENRIPSYRSDLIASANVGDDLFDSAEAWVVTRDEQYAQACVQTISRWLHDHPATPGTHGDTTVAVSRRIVRWCWTLVMIRESQAVTGTWLQEVLASLWLQATYVRRYLSYYCTRNTDLMTETLGLLYISTLFAEFRDAARWRETATRILLAECEAQVCRDGVHFERSTGSHKYSAEIYLHFLLLAERNGVEVPEPIRARVEQMIEFLLAIRQPDGSIPAIGDDDGGRLRTLGREQPDSRQLFGVAAALFHRRDFAWAAEELTPDVAWLLGGNGVAAFDALASAPPATSASRVFPSGGYASLRSGWEPDAHHAIVDIGPIGCPVSGGHGHADLLSIQCSIFGEPALVDAGTYCFSGEPEWREYFRSTAAHSAVVVDGHSQAQPDGSFGWRGQPRVRLREWHSTPQFDFLDADHDGYCTLADPVVHRRRVIFVKPGYWILVDDLTGAARHQIDLAFQFGPLDVTLGAHPWARAQTAGGRVLWICPFPSAPVQPALKCGELSPIRGWISPHFGTRQPAPMLIYSFAVALPWRIVTLLLPDRQGMTTPPAVRAIYDAAGQPTGIAFERPQRVVRFDDQAVSVERE